MNPESRVKYLERLKTQEAYSHKDIYYAGRKDKMPVYKIDISYLVYNKWNGRIASLVKSYNRETGTEIDPTDAKGIELIEKFLWKSNEPANDATLRSIQDQGQNEYGIVTKDGVIIDGNRRAMMLKKAGLAKQEKPVYFLGVILDETLDDNPSEIMRLETTYQMGEDKKVDYSPIEKYLKCQDLKAYFETDQIAKMMGEPVRQIENYLSIMRLMDEYLDHLGYSGIYTRLDKTEGMFVDLNGYLERYEGGKSKMVQWKYDDSDIADLKLIHFDYIRGIYNRGKSGSESGDSKDYRFIAQTSKKGSFFSNREVWEKFRNEHFTAIDSINEKEPTIDKDREQSPEQDLDDLLKLRDARWAKKADAPLKKNLGLSRAMLENRNKQNEPLELLQGAKDKLLAINTEGKEFLDDERVLPLIDEINRITYEFKKMVKAFKKQLPA